MVSGEQEAPMEAMAHRHAAVELAAVAVAAITWEMGMLEVTVAALVLAVEEVALV